MTEAPLGQTPWQTIGPFFHYGLPRPGSADRLGRSDLGGRGELFPVEHDVIGRCEAPPLAGEPIEISGRLLDGAGEPVRDGLIEIWHADPDGRFPVGWDGFARAATNDDGSFRFRTIRPGRTRGADGAPCAAHIDVGVLGRGLIKRLVTRLYFEGSDGLAEDPIFGRAPAARRHTLLARRDGDAWRFDIRLQGADETVFFAC